VRDVLLNNSHGVSVVTKACKRTTAELPFLNLPEKEAWTILNPILNVISEIFACGFVARDLGIPVASDWFWCGLTCEKDGPVKNTKVRVMLIKESLLEQLNQIGTPTFEYEHHQIRWKTLLEMKRLYDIQKKEGSMLLMKMELCYPTHLLLNSNQQNVKKV